MSENITVPIVFVILGILFVIGTGGGSKRSGWDEVREYQEECARFIPSRMAC